MFNPQQRLKGCDCLSPTTVPLPYSLNRNLTLLILILITSLLWRDPVRANGFPPPVQRLEALEELGRRNALVARCRPPAQRGPASTQGIVDGLKIVADEPRDFWRCAPKQHFELKVLGPATSGVARPSSISS